MLILKPRAPRRPSANGAAARRAARPREGVDHAAQAEVGSRLIGPQQESQQELREEAAVSAPEPSAAAKRKERDKIRKQEVAREGAVSWEKAIPNLYIVADQLAAPPADMLCRVCHRAVVDTVNSARCMMCISPGPCHLCPGCDTLLHGPHGDRRRHDVVLWSGERFVPRKHPEAADCHMIYADDVEMPLGNRRRALCPAPARVL